MKLRSDKIIGTTMSPPNLLANEDGQSTSVGRMIERSRTFLVHSENQPITSTIAMISKSLSTELLKMIVEASSEEIVEIVEVARKLDGLVPLAETRESNPTPTKSSLRQSEIPTFDGNPLNYEMFEESFREIVISNNSIPTTLKKQYLTMAVKESKTASAMVQSLLASLTINETLDKLRSQFGTSEATFFEVQSSLRGCSRLKSVHDAEGWNKLYLILVQAEPRLKDPVQIQMVKGEALTKLPPESIMHVGKHNDYSLKPLVELAESMRSLAKITMATERSVPFNRRTEPIDPNKCVMCFNNHATHQCPNFATTPLRMIQSKLRRAGLCIRCAKHKFSSGSRCSAKCNKCSMNHATYLCKNSAERVNTISTEPNEQTEDPMQQVFQLPDQH